MSALLAITGCGMVSGLGIGGEFNAAAMRLGYDCCQQTPWRVPGRDAPLIGAPCTAAGERRGAERLAWMLLPALREAAQALPTTTRTPAPAPPRADLRLLLCVADDAADRGLIDDLDALLAAPCAALAGGRCDPARAYLPRGVIGFAHALALARGWLRRGECTAVLIGAVDSLLDGAVISRDGGDCYGDGCRLQGGAQADGYLPGEAGTAVLVTLAAPGPAAQLLCTGIGFGREDAPIGSGAVCRADGLTAAIVQACERAGCTAWETDFRLSTLNGESWFFEEDNLALARTFGRPKPLHDLWHPAEAVGHAGAALGAVLAVRGYWAARKGDAPGPRMLCTFTGDGPARAAAVLEWRAGPAAGDGAT